MCCKLDNTFLKYRGTFDPLVASEPLLSEVYIWFTEGFDTKDSQEAKALLDALSQES